MSYSVKWAEITAIRAHKKIFRRDNFHPKLSRSNSQYFLMQYLFYMQIFQQLPNFIVDVCLKK